MWCCSSRCAIPSRSAIPTACMQDVQNLQAIVSINLIIFPTTVHIFYAQTPTSFCNTPTAMYNNDLRGFSRRSATSKMRPVPSLLDSRNGTDVYVKHAGQCYASVRIEHLSNLQYFLT